MAKRKYYAVAEGRICGIFTDWSEVEKQVKGFAGAKYKSFFSEGEARSWLEDPVYKKKDRSVEPTPQSGLDNGRKTIAVYTDGGCINNPGPGGYGIVIDTSGGQREFSGGYRLTTNNRMEMMAAIVALQELRGTKRQVRLYSDSSYLVNGITKGWAPKWRSRGWCKADGRPAMNIDLWQKLLELLEEMNVLFIWVKGHSGNELNERCDQLAVSAARQKGLPADLFYETLANSGREKRGEGTL